jgi:hypothetical protein
MSYDIRLAQIKKTRQCMCMSSAHQIGYLSYEHNKLSDYYSRHTYILIYIVPELPNQANKPCRRKRFSRALKTLTFSPRNIPVSPQARPSQIILEAFAFHYDNVELLLGGQDQSFHSSNAVLKPAYNSTRPEWASQPFRHLASSQHPSFRIPAPQAASNSQYVFDHQTRQLLT